MIVLSHFSGKINEKGCPFDPDRSYSQNTQRIPRNI